MVPPRFPLQVMLGISIAASLTGIALGAQAGRGTQEVGAASREVAGHREGRDHIAVEQSVAPPFPISPRSGAEVAGRPVLAWRLEEGTNGARVELSPTSDFDEATLRRIDVRGEQLALPASWPPGIWYWRLRGLDDATVGDRSTPTWMVYVIDPASAS